MIRYTYLFQKLENLQKNQAHALFKVKSMIRF